MQSWHLIAARRIQTSASVMSHRSYLKANRRLLVSPTVNCSQGHLLGSATLTQKHILPNLGKAGVGSVAMLATANRVSLLSPACGVHWILSSALEKLADRTRCCLLRNVVFPQKRLRSPQGFYMQSNLIRRNKSQSVGL